MSTPAKQRKHASQNGSNPNGTTTGNLEGWQTRAILRGVALPSGMVVDVRPLSLETHLTYGQTPNALRVVAVADLRAKLGNQQLDPSARAEALDEYVGYQRGLICAMLVNPTITEDDLAHLPEQDVEWLIALGNRQVTEDAAGRALGVESLNQWTIFRNEHDCADDCPSCLRVVNALSTALPG